LKALFVLFLLLGFSPKEKKGKGGETRKQQQQEHDGNTYIQKPSKSKLV
jgi:hypothetical protein